ncbi:helix-turn-helix domain-containing protein [Streptomyces griseus]|uniref:helix-turn-helix domain-containing protein n=1 Tax=Streptomyces griseus TaxID=1911 RepID=UPI0036553D71
MPERPTAAERVAANVKLIRTQRGWTRGKLADRAGLPESKVSALEDGRHVRPQPGRRRNHNHHRPRHHSWVTTRFRQYGRVVTSVIDPFDKPK